MAVWSRKGENRGLLINKSKRLRVDGVVGSVLGAQPITNVLVRSARRCVHSITHTWGSLIPRQVFELGRGQC